MIATGGYIVEFAFLNISYVINHRHATSDVFSQAGNVSVATAFDEIPLIKHKRHVIPALVDCVVSLALELRPNVYQRVRNGFVSL